MLFNPQIEQALSAARFQTYRDIALSDEHAWNLYRWNVELASATMPLVADLEVALRNTMHDRLSSHFGRSDWWASDKLLLDRDTHENVARTVELHQKKIASGKVSAGRVVSELMFGTWVMLLTRGGNSAIGQAVDYEARLWRPILRKGFATTRGTRPRRPSREEAHSRAALVQRLRNRCAHHEPIFNGIKKPGTATMIPLLEVWEQAVQLLDWVCPDLGDMHRSQALLPNTIADKPTS